MSIESLSHTVRELPGGGFVLVLDTGATIGPEAEAMLQALHSRSIGGIKSHLAVLQQRGPEKFMSTYYVGYGHKSIGDCGTCTIFIEGVSMLVAKAIQDWPLYSGQEASTRYIDFASQNFIDPVGTATSNQILEKLRAFYLRGIDELLPHLMAENPQGEMESASIYEKAIHARAFDIMRGFLPAGATTNLAWHSNLRQVADKLLWLRHHPLAEVRIVADAIESAVLAAFPSSFGTKRYETTEEYMGHSMDRYYFSHPSCPEFELVFDGIDRKLLNEYRDDMLARPPKTELPKHLAECGVVRFEFLLDFGSFRDLQRQRSVTQRMPLLGFEHGIHPWYLERLTPTLRESARALLTSHQKAVESLGLGANEKQYYVPMGFQTPNRLTGTLPALAYITELRSGITVHPTLRERAQQMGTSLVERFGDAGLVLHLDTTPDRFNVRRGKDDIVKKDS